MLGMPLNALRKYWVPATAEAEPRVTVFQSVSVKDWLFQSEAIVEDAEVIFHSVVFITG